MGEAQPRFNKAENKEPRDSCPCIVCLQIWKYCATSKYRNTEANVKIRDNFTKYSPFVDTMKYRCLTALSGMVKYFHPFLAILGNKGETQN